MGLFKKRNVNGKRTKEHVDPESSDEDETVVVTKQSKQDQTNTNSSKAEADYGQVRHDHSHTRAIIEDDAATREDTLIKDAQKLDAMAAEEKDRIRQERESNPDDNIYRGRSSYRKYGEDGDGKPKKIGPAKSAANVRATTVVDYQPDVCKDYKQTGFCGYGDSCKFLHAREDYAAGWKLEQDWEKSKNSNSEQTKDNTKDAEKEPEIPFKCVICKEDYKSPVVTKCQHYFCEECFFTEYRRKKGCFICGKDTAGVAQPAKKLKDLAKKAST